MFKQLTCEIPNTCVVACSGGADSLAALIFAHNHGKLNVTALHVKHGDSRFANNSALFVNTVCEGLNIPIDVVEIPMSTGSRNISQEAQWSVARAEVYSRYNAPVTVAHTLDDAVEWWLMRAIRGKQPTLIKTENRNVIRPFLLWSKDDMKEYLTYRRRVWMEDPTNHDGTSNMRSVIRAKLSPVVNEISDLKPAIYRMYLKQVTERRQLSYKGSHSK